MKEYLLGKLDLYLAEKKIPDKLSRNRMRANSNQR